MSVMSGAASGGAGSAEVEAARSIRVRSPPKRADLPRQIVVPVDERCLGEQVLDALCVGGGARGQR